MSDASSLCTVCILAGGRGTRLGEQVRDVPKPLIEVAGEPFLFHQLRQLRSYGARRIVLCVGYLGELIERAVGTGEAFGLSIDYSYDAPGLDGTAGAVRRALHRLGDRFMVLYGDSYLRIDYPKVERAFRDSGLPALMTVLRNEDRWDTSNAVYRDGLVVRHDKRHPSSDMRWIDYGLGVLSPEALDAAPEEGDLAEVYAELARRGLLAGYEVSERFYEIGTPESLRETDRFLRDLRAGSAS